MAKETREYSNLEFSQLVSIVDKALEHLQEWSWDVRQKKDGKKGGVVWRGMVPINNSMVSMPFEVYYKLLKIEVSEGSVLLECTELNTKMRFDTPGEKMLITKEFFDHIESMIKDDKLSPQYQPRKKIVKWKSFRILLYFLLAWLTFGIISLIIIRYLFLLE